MEAPALPDVTMVVSKAQNSDNQHNVNAEDVIKDNKYYKITNLGSKEKLNDINATASLQRPGLPFLMEIKMMKERITNREDYEDSLEEPAMKWCTPLIQSSAEIMTDSLESGGNQHIDFSDEDDGDDENDGNCDNAESDKDESEEELEVKMCERYVPPSDMLMDTIVEVSEDNYDTNDELDEMHAVIDINVGYCGKKDGGHNRSGPIYLDDTDDFAIDLNNIDQDIRASSEQEDTQNSQKQLDEESLLEQENPKHGGLFLPGPVSASPRLASTPNPLPKPPRIWPQQETNKHNTVENIPQYQKISETARILPAAVVHATFNNDQREREELEVMIRNREAIDTVLKSDKSSSRRRSNTVGLRSTDGRKSSKEQPEPTADKELESGYCVRNMAQFWEAFCQKVQQETELLTGTRTPTVGSAVPMSSKRWKSMPDLEKKHEQDSQQDSIQPSGDDDLSLADERPVVKSDEVVDDLDVCKTISIRERCQLFEHLAARAASEAAGRRSLAGSDGRQWSSMPSLKSPAAGRRGDYNLRRQQWESSSLQRSAERPNSLLQRRQMERPATSCGIHTRPMSPINR
jgi:dsDNA-binding SOS-regulon protein